MATSSRHASDGLDAEILLALVERGDATTVSLARGFGLAQYNPGATTKTQRRRPGIIPAPYYPRARDMRSQHYERLNPPGLR